MKSLEENICDLFVEIEFALDEAIKSQHSGSFATYWRGQKDALHWVWDEMSERFKFLKPNPNLDI